MSRPGSLAAALQSAWLRRGLGAILLLPLAGVYATLHAAHVALYRSGLKKSFRLPRPVIVVGNLIAGGAGKTPTTIALVAMLRRRGHTPGVISRGYGRASDGVLSVDAQTPAAQGGDEPLLLHLRTQAPVVVGRNRIAAAQLLLQAHPEVDVIVSDDGLQHYRLQRDAQVIVFDERGIGNGWPLPAGPLREQPGPRAPAKSVVVYNAPRPSMPWPGHVAQRRLAGLLSLADWWQGLPANEATLAELASASAKRPVIAAAGIAHPQRFFGMLRAHGLQITEMPLPDHHGYAHRPWPDGDVDVVVTEKDAVKLRPEQASAARIWVATLDFQLDPDFEQELLQWLPTSHSTLRN